MPDSIYVDSIKVSEGPFTRWQLGWKCRSDPDPEGCFIEKLTWLGGRPYFGRRVLCRFHEVILGDETQRHMAGDILKYMGESSISFAKILDERGLEAQLEHTPVTSTSLKDVRDIIHGGCCTGPSVNMRGLEDA